MSLSDELQRLADLRSSGALTEPEFQQAKAKLLKEDRPPPRREFRDSDSDSLGNAANRYVAFEKAKMVFSGIVFLIILIVIASKMCGSSGPSFGPSIPFP